MSSSGSVTRTDSATADDLIRRTAFLARRLAQRRDEVTTLGVAGFGVADTLLAGGAFELGQAVLDSLTRSGWARSGGQHRSGRSS